ncbi:hypothetical protein BO78DRAFT_471888 [Aspergillus sclerotiicarbonarius CBS 121057]|uniref:Zn(2)-C6 fungal-type domain-containing protein n=1 Tax=Aspergillus sclerotiicarbonarius (strain CBS 121057 / IBT 28362) TaxID=1448318 RepID=A0A319E0H0_ASPSB|nr:hypothetical protein BO78DRAFT_471888 [Aspergillus sclerotiicarbonarius CBS 121057]
MTFCGRPSKACLSCRQRRIKCNRAVPVCSQCRRAGKQCTGYRDEVPLLFRDENARTIRRSVRAKELSEERRTAANFTHLTASTEHQIQHTLDMTLACHHLAAPIDEQGLQFFFHHFATPHAANSNKEPLSHPFLRRILEDNFSRQAAVAIGLAAASNSGHGPALLKIARQNYGQTLQTLRQTVQAATVAKSLDCILLIILMLALFEFVDCDASSITSWAVHADGAAAVLQRFSARERLQVDYRAQLQYYFSMFVKYFFMGGSPPVECGTWSPCNVTTPPAEDQPAVTLVGILMKLAQIYSTLLDGVTMSVEKVARTALAIEAELAAWETTLPDKWSYELKHSKNMPYTFNGLYHIYRDAWASRVMNNYRYARLLVNDIILTYTTDPNTTANLVIRKQALATVTQMATEICIASSSQVFREIYHPEGNGIPPPPAINGVFMVLFLLTVAAWGTGVPDVIFEWVADTLRTIGYTKGIRHALYLVPKLQYIDCGAILYILQEPAVGKYDIRTLSQPPVASAMYH